MQRAEAPLSSLWARKAWSINRSKMAIKAALPDSGTRALGHSLDWVYLCFCRDTPLSPPACPGVTESFWRETPQTEQVGTEPWAYQVPWFWVSIQLGLLLCSVIHMATGYLPWPPITCNGHQSPAMATRYLPGPSFTSHGHHRPAMVTLHLSGPPLTCHGHLSPAVVIPHLPGPPLTCQDNSLLPGPPFTCHGYPIPARTTPHLPWPPFTCQDHPSPARTILHLPGPPLTFQDHPTPARANPHLLGPPLTCQGDPEITD